MAIIPFNLSHLLDPGYSCTFDQNISLRNDTAKRIAIKVIRAARELWNQEQPIYILLNDGDYRYRRDIDAQNSYKIIEDDGTGQLIYPDGISPDDIHFSYEPTEQDIEAYQRLRLVDKQASTRFAQRIIKETYDSVVEDNTEGGSRELGAYQERLARILILIKARRWGIWPMCSHVVRDDN